MTFDFNGTPEEGGANCTETQTKKPFATGAQAKCRSIPMFSRIDSIDGFHLKVSRIEKELFEEFLKTEEPDIPNQMHEYFVQAKGQPVGIQIDNREPCS